VRRWLASSPSNGDAAWARALLPVGVVLGLASEGAGFSWDEPERWLPDLVVGLTFIGAGAYALPRQPGCGALLTATGLTWFAGTVDASALYLHRGPLVQLLVAYPGWRPRTRTGLVAVAAGYAAALARPVWGDDSAAVVLVVLLVGAVAHDCLIASGRVRRDGLVALKAATALAGAVAVGAAVRMVVPSGEAGELVLLGYEAVLCGVAVYLAAHVRPPPVSTVADLVVELSEGRSGPLRDALAATLGDSTLEVGYRVAGGDYRDSAGRTVALPPPGENRVATFVTRDGRPFAVLVHDIGVLDEPALVEAVAAATRLTAANASLQGELRDQLAELEASRRRLVLAADEERRRLEGELRRGALQRVSALIDVVRSARPAAGPAAREHLARTEEHLVCAGEDLARLAQGLHPGDLRDGLPHALAALAGRGPVPVEVTVAEGCPLAGETAVAAYYVCAEALANVAKHAGGACARVEVVPAGAGVRVVVVDDGPGGADPARGSGLRGLADRVEALGGTLHIDSPSGGGTRLTAELAPAAGADRPT